MTVTNQFRNALDDLRYALRQLRRSPGFTLAATVILGLGIGAATSVFSLVDTVLLRPLPFAEPEWLVALNSLERPAGSAGAATIPSDTSYPNFFDWRAQATSFTALASWDSHTATLEGLGGAPARRAGAMSVSADFFRVFGVRPALGRGFTRSEEAAGNRSVILSHGLWQRAFAGSPSVLGQTLHLNEEAYTIIGVLPAGVVFPEGPDAELWTTLAPAMEGKNPSGAQRGWNQIAVVGRLKPGVSIEQARAEMQTIQQALAAQYPDDDKNLTGVSLVPEMQSVVGNVAQLLDMLFAAVSILLLIACANVAGLLLTRSSARRPVLALRLALGASRVAVTRQLLIESLTLSALGGLFGLALAALVLRIAPQYLPDLPRMNELALNARVFGFAMGAALATGLLFGVAPAWRSSRQDPALALRDHLRAATGGRSQNRLHRLLVIGETALGLVLLVGAGLLMRSFDRLLSVDPGFDTRHLLTFKLAMPDRRFDDRKKLQFSEQMQGEFAPIPGVKQATFGYPMPLRGDDMTIAFAIPGQPLAPGERPSARASVVAANFFQTLSIPLRRGRLFSTADRQGGAPVVIVNQAFADRFFPGHDALGKGIVSGLADAEPGRTPQAAEIVGIVGNVQRKNLSEASEPEYYVPFAQAPLIQPTFSVRVAGDPAAYIEAVRRLVARRDPTLPVYRVITNLRADSTAQQKFQALLLSGFALLALLLAAVGLYGVLSYMIAQRTGELGLRLALGAQRGDVLRLVLGRGLRLTAVGLALGLGASALLTRYLATLLFDTRALDPLTFAGMTLLLGSVSALACFGPAWRASRLNPNDTLRQL